ncbi:MAG: helix-turn-helix domain-containing protein [Bacteroidales bacterium]|nr:helix-turn-helix domain-containing protein [Bacteroidales bacterium]MCF8456596.1 helix-turn-helix domain-containing protein [Bacteroidales bacterium]
MKLRCFLLGFLILPGINFSLAQSIDSAQFETEYDKLLQVLDNAQDSIEQVLFIIDQKFELNEIQKARLNLIKVESQDLINEDISEGGTIEPEILSTENLPILEKARKYLEQGRPTMAIPLVLKYLETAGTNSDSADFARITLAEGYRSVKEFQKGIELTNEVLNKTTLSLKNRAYACNRLAALYAEFKAPSLIHRGDSIVKYSNLCIQLAMDNGFTFHLATAQNELAFYYWAQKNYNLALDYAHKAFKNFTDAGKQPQALRTVSNIAQIYYEMGRYSDGLEILNKTMDHADINENRSAFLSIYLTLASINRKMGNLSEAYEYLRTGRQLQSILHKKMIEAQIYDLAAQYEAEKKENENKELRMANEIKALKIADKSETIHYLVLVIGIIGISLVLILFQFFQKRKAYNRLVKANLIIVKAEREYRLISEKVGQDFSGEKIDLQQNTVDENNELLIKLEACMEEEKPYLDSNITLDDICHKLQTNRTYLSKLINEHFHKNFNEYINDFRTKTARQILADTSKNHISIEGVGQMSGFNSRSTFFTCFKKQTGLSPSYFRDTIFNIK